MAQGASKRGKKESLDEALRDYENAIVEGDQEESAWEQVMLLARHCEGTSPKFFEHSIVISHYARALLIGDPARIQAARHTTDTTVDVAAIDH